MSEKRFRKLQGYMADNNRKYDNGDVYAMDFTEVEDMLNALHEENKQLKEKYDALQKKIEMDKNDFFISEAKRMRLLAFIEDNELRKEYHEWERRIWNE